MKTRINDEGNLTADGVCLASEEKIMYDDKEVERDFGKAKNKCLRLLGYSARTRKQLYDKLCGEGYSCEIAERAIVVMESYGYIDDKKYADEYVRAAVESKGHGKYRIMQDLYNKGIEKAVVSKAIAEYYEQAEKHCEDAELQNAVSVLEKKAGHYDLSDIKGKNNAYMFMQRRGFGHSTIKEAFKILGQNIGEYYS